MTRIPAAKRIRHMGAISAGISFVLVAQSAALRIAVVSGEGAVHAAGSHAAKPLTVEVTDQAGRPVEGARVSFQTPDEGPGGVFSSRLHTDLTVTDASGRATVRALDLNRTPGPFSIRITAAKDQARAGVIVKQFIGETKTVVAMPPDATPAVTAGQAGNLSANAMATAAANPSPETGEVKAVAAIVAGAGKTETAPNKLSTGGRVTASANWEAPKTVNSKNGATVAVVPTPASVQAIPAAASPTKPDTSPTARGAQARSRSASVPTIVITQGAPGRVVDPGAGTGRKSHKKWIWIAVLAAAGAAGTVAGPGLVAGTAAHGSPTTPGIPPAVSIGPPTISIGKP